MAMLLYDLGDAAGRPVSPYCWRIREALHSLGLEFESQLLSLTQIRAQLTGAHRTVPLLVDDGRQVGDSGRIAEYLAESHDPQGRLFGGVGGVALARFVTDWVDATLMAPANRMLVKDIHDGLREEDRADFRRRQEQHLGATLESLESTRENLRPAFQTALYPARRALKAQPFLGGDNPNYGDFTLHSLFQWSRAVSSFALLREDDRLQQWIERMDDWLTGPNGVHAAGC